MSRFRFIRKDEASGSFVQAYNAQVAVEGKAQITVAAGVTQAANDKPQMLPTAQKARENLGRLPEQTLAGVWPCPRSGCNTQALLTLLLSARPYLRLTPRSLSI